LAETIASVPSVSAVAIDACALPFATDCFDVVMANHMLYHVADLDRAAAELRRVIVEGGTLGAVTNSHEHLRELLDLLAQVAGRPRRILPSDRFNLEESGADLERHFSHVEVRHHVGQLVVPDVEPLVTYARSSRPLSGRGYDEEDWERLMRDFELAVAAVIQREGAMHITTHAGSFVCH
jgi:SAM-dependent methyltransferase